MSELLNIKAIVSQSHKSDFPHPLVVKKGEKLQLGKKTTNFKGWVWCLAADKKSGWVPESFLKITENRCVMLVAYDATELTVAVGDSLTILSQESEWAWCLSSNNQKGWVPLENVRKL